MARIAVLTALLALAACGDALHQGPTPAVVRPSWQNAPANATFEPSGARPPGS